MWELLLSPGSDGNSDRIKEGSWVMRSVRSHLFISAGGEYRVYSSSVMESTLMMLDACHRQVRMTCHRISGQSATASLLLPCVLFCSILARLSESFTWKRLTYNDVLMWKQMEKYARWECVLFVFSNFRPFQRNVMVFLHCCKDLKDQTHNRKGALLEQFIHKYITIVPKL